MNTSVIKPLGRKAYGSIPHLPTSRLGPGDHHCHEGQSRICLERTRDRHDVVIVTEKLDGSCVSAARIDGAIVPLGRAGYPAQSSEYRQHRMFAEFCWENQDRFLRALSDGQRFVGEWLVQAHGTRYDLRHEPFVVFDLMEADRRLPFETMRVSAAAGNFITPRLLHIGGSYSIVMAQIAIAISGHGAVEPVEGAVWRVERKDHFDFIAKWVRPDKVDGCYLPERSGREIWNVAEPEVEAPHA